MGRKLLYGKRKSLTELRFHKLFSPKFARFQIHAQIQFRPHNSTTINFQLPTIQNGRKYQNCPIFDHLHPILVKTIERFGGQKVRKSSRTKELAIQYAFLRRF